MPNSFEYVLSQAELEAIIKCYMKKSIYLSPFVKISMCEIIDRLKRDMTIRSIEDCQVILSLFPNIICEQETSVSSSQKKRRIAVEMQHEKNTDIQILLQNIKLFTEHNRISIEYKKEQMHDK